MEVNSHNRVIHKTFIKIVLSIRQLIVTGVVNIFFNFLRRDFENLTL